MHGRHSSRHMTAILFATGAAIALAVTASAQQPAQPTPKVVVTDYDMARAAAPLPLSPAELAGKKLFVQRCALPACIYRSAR